MPRRRHELAGKTTSEPNKAKPIDNAGKRLEAIIEGAVFGIITIDDRGTVEQTNAAAEKMFQYKDSDVIGQNVSM